MPVTEQTPVIAHNGNGVTTVFAYNYKIPAAADMEVTVDGVVKTLTTDYSVSGVGVDGGGSVTMVTPPASGTENVVLRRNMAYSRSNDYQDNGDLLAVTADEDADRPIMMLQQLVADIARSIKLPVGVTTDQVIAESSADRVGKLVSFDSSGNIMLSAPADFTLTTVSAFIATLLDDVNAAAARATLGAQAQSALLDAIVSGTTSLGYRNKIINGNMRVAQRASTTALSGSRQFGPVDRFTALLAGSSVSGTLTRDTAAGANTSSGNALHLSGISYTSGYPLVGHRIEAKDTASLNGKQITVSCKVYHDFGSSRNFAITLNKANAADDFSGVTAIGSGASVACASGAWTQVSYTLVLGATDASNGLEVLVNDVATSTVASKNVKFGDFQLEVGAVATTFEDRPYELELALCQRYLPVFTAGSTTDDIGAGWTTTNNTGMIDFPFVVEPRIPPTGITTSAVGQFTITGHNGATSVASALTFSRAGKKVGRMAFTGTANPYTTQTGCYMFANTSGAQILFTGAEL